MAETLSIDEVTPDFKNEREKQLFSDAQLGLAAQQFMDSQVGRLVTKRMNEVVQDCAYKMLDATSFEDMKALQRRADIAEQSVKWIVEAITEGEMAFQQLSTDNE